MTLYKYAELLDEFEETKQLRIKEEFDLVALTQLQRDFLDTRILPLQTTFKYSTAYSCSTIHSVNGSVLRYFDAQ